MSQYYVYDNDLEILLENKLYDLQLIRKNYVNILR